VTYASSTLEKAAAALLRRHGWDVSEPPCPVCHGAGFISDGPNRFTVTETQNPTITNSVSVRPCPEGCFIPYRY